MLNVFRSLLILGCFQTEDYLIRTFSKQIDLALIIFDDDTHSLPFACELEFLHYPILYIFPFPTLNDYSIPDSLCHLPSRPLHRCE